MKNTKKVAPPTDLAQSAAFWASVTDEFVFEPHHLAILHQACICLDRIEACKADIAAHGLTIDDRFGQSRANPAAELEIKYARNFKSHMRELGLDVAPADAGYDRATRLPSAGRILKHA